MRSITVSLPVRNLKVSVAFFAELGFTFSPEPSAPGTARLMIEQNISVLLMAAERYRGQVNGDASCAGSGGEALLCLSAGSAREVDEIVMKAVIAGGRPWPIAAERPVHSASFLDPDGHLWQVTCPREQARQEHGSSGTRRTVRASSPAPGDAVSPGHAGGFSQSTLTRA